MERIQELINQSRNKAWVSYLSILVIVLVKPAFTALCLNVGSLLLGFNATFRQFFKIALVAESVHCISSLWRSVHYIFIVDVKTLADFGHYFPLSALNFFRPGELAPIFNYPLQLVNLFELLYVLLLAVGVASLMDREYRKSPWLVVSTYGIGLITWVVTIIFISVSAT